MGFIYLIESSGLYKIGATKNNPQERVKKLNTGNPNLITLIHFFECEKYFKVEKFLHKKYYNKTEANNEWRKLTKEQVNNFLKDCEQICENLNYIYKNNHFLKNDKTTSKR